MRRAALALILAAGSLGVFDAGGTADPATRRLLASTLANELAPAGHPTIGEEELALLRARRKQQEEQCEKGPCEVDNAPFFTSDGLVRLG